MNINGTSIILESDGSLIDEGELIPLVKDELLILLKSNETWCPIILEPIEFSMANQLDEQNSSLISSVSLEPSAHEDRTPAGSTQEDTSSSQVYPYGTINISCNSEIIWKNFLIPWDKVPHHIIAEFNTSRKVKQSITSFLHIVIDQMRSIKTLIPIKAFKLVAYKIIDKYPQIFEDKDEDGVVLGDGSATLCNKLKERNNYLNRPCKRPQKVYENPTKNKRQRISQRAGCSNWSPDVMYEDCDDTNSFLNKFSDQRSFINSNPKATLMEIIKKWPDFGTPTNVESHFKELTNSNINLMDKFVETKFTQICEFAKSAKTVNIENIDIVIECANNSDKQFKFILDVFINYFNESIDEILLIKVTIFIILYIHYFKLLLI